MDKYYINKYAEKQYNNGVFSVIVAGVAIGIILGVLFAPDKGSETRRKISEKGAKMRQALNGGV